MVEVASRPLRPLASPFGEWFDSEMFGALSSDGQVYLECASCAAVLRLEFTPSLPAAGKYPCPKCRGQLRVVRHRAWAEAHCRDGEHRFEYEPRAWDVPRCPICYSRSVELGPLSVTPPYPTTFGSVGFMVPLPSAPKLMGDHFWGLSPAEDAAQLRALCMNYKIPVSPFHRLGHVATYALYLLGDRLLGTYQDISQADRVNYLWTLSCLLKVFFEMTADPVAIASALALEHCASTIDPEDPVLVALSQHNFAISAIDALEVYDESVFERLTGWTGLRSIAIAAAEAALTTVRSTPGRGNADLQAARIEYAMADLYRGGSPTPDELARAIEIYDRLVERDDMSYMAEFIKISRALAILKRGVDDDDKTFLSALQTLKDAVFGPNPLKIGRRSKWATILGQTFVRYGAHDEAIPLLESAVTFAQKDTRPLFDRLRLTRDAEEQATAYSSLANAYVRGGRADEALSLLETWRGRVLSSRKMTNAERNAASSAADTRRDEQYGGLFFSPNDTQTLVVEEEQVQELQTGRRFGPFADDYELDGLFLTLQRFMDAPERKRTIFVEIALETLAPEFTVASAIVNAADRTKGLNGWFAYQWRVDSNDEALLRSDAHARPSAFQEERLEKLVQVGARTLLQPMQAAFAATDPDLVVISLPGALSNLPFEAFAEAARVVDPQTPWPRVFAYAPSLRTVAESGLPPPLAADARLLVVNYNDQDLPSAKAEVAEMVAAFEGRADVVAAGSTKRALIEALACACDAVHFVCHGTYEANSPLDSALVLRRYGTRDADRLTAAEIIDFVRFRGSPIVTLSACSSALTADSRTNTWYGLPGSLVEAGAHCVIGSRWPVKDEVARRTMVSFYQALLSTRGGVAATLRDVQDEIRKEAGLKDWACFGALHG
jgi:tetratricopeptide (TPR) repeat protein